MLNRLQQHRLQWVLHPMLALIVLLLSGILTVHTQPGQPAFKIGILGEGNSSLAKGALLVMDRLNNEGGVRGADGTFFRLEPIFAPLTADTTPADVAARLSSEGVIAAIGPVTTNELASLSSQLQTLNIPILTMATGDSLVMNDRTGNLIRVRATDFLMARALADHLVNNSGIRSFEVIQFDIDATVNVLGFTSAAQSFGAPVRPARLLNTTDLFAPAIQEIVAQNPGVVVTYGEPALAGEFFVQLRVAGYAGLFAHPSPTADAFRGDTPPEEFAGMLSAVTWSYTATDPNSEQFLMDYVRQYGEIPGDIQAAAADAVQLLANGIGLPGALRDNLRALEETVGIQGIISGAGLAPGEISGNVAVVQLNAYGSPVIVARYIGTERVEAIEISEPTPTVQPTATATPEGVVATIISQRQNVRTGPSTDYAIIGQLNEGEQVRVIGATIDLNWLVIDFRGRQGWIANLPNLNEIFGNLNSVPIITPPATPTPVPTATTAPPQEADIIIQSASISPNPIVPNQPFNLAVVIANVGRSDAGPFAIAGTLPPNNVYSSANISGLAVGQTTTVVLTGTLQNTGNYSVVIVADLNNQVPEGPGENNNGSFAFNYVIDYPTVNRGSGTAVAGSGFSLSSEVSVLWDGNFLIASSGQIGPINGVDYSRVHYDLINASAANQPSLQPQVGSVIAILNPSGARGVLRVDAINGSEITATYKAYNSQP